MSSLEPESSPDQPGKKWKVYIEFEGYGKDGQEIIGHDLSTEIIVEAADEDTAEDIACNQDFGNRRVSYAETQEIREEE